jgi:small conductance mechanosensitive channel
VGAHWLLFGRQRELGSEKKFTRQLILLALTIFGILAIAVSLPIGESTRNQVIAFIGLVVSGVLAFSSTTIFANLMAGIMMRITRPFRAGDFIRVDRFFGRVAERGFLDTEIQTESRDLIAIPNTFLINHPVSVIRSSGTFVSITISLGYDLHHSRIESLLLEAARLPNWRNPLSMSRTLVILPYRTK